METNDTTVETTQRPSTLKRDLRAIGLFLIVVLLFMFSFKMGVVHGNSMLPTYHDGELVLVNKIKWLQGTIQKGDVVLVRMNKDVLIKRVAYLPGEKISYPKSVNFYAVREFFEIPKGASNNPYNPGFELSVPMDSIVVLGDNPDVSEDSRAFGPVTKADLLGMVVRGRPNQRDNRTR